MTEMVLVPEVALKRVLEAAQCQAYRRQRENSKAANSDACRIEANIDKCNGEKVSAEMVKECDEAVMDLVGSSRGNLEIGAFTKVVIKALGLDVEGGE